VYRWVDHTSEVELEIEAGDEREAFEEAMRALAELLGVDSAESTTECRLTARAADRPALLAAWIEELVFLAESKGFVATRVIDIDLCVDGLQATVAGVLGEPPPLVKAVTYHRLLFEPRDQRYVARVVLDV
jgi:SHS2 domain-containing protein